MSLTPPPTSSRLVPSSSRLLCLVSQLVSRLPFHEPHRKRISHALCMSLREAMLSHHFSAVDVSARAYAISLDLITPASTRSVLLTSQSVLCQLHFSHIFGHLKWSSYRHVQTRPRLCLIVQACLCHVIPTRPFLITTRPTSFDTSSRQFSGRSRKKPYLASASTSSLSSDRVWLLHVFALVLDFLPMF